MDLVAALAAMVEMSMSVIVRVRMLRSHSRLFPAAIGETYVDLRRLHSTAVHRPDLDGDLAEAQAAGKRP
jgi:hypothetical protein